jgi:hypothetical protein
MENENIFLVLKQRLKPIMHLNIPLTCSCVKVTRKLSQTYTMDLRNFKPLISNISAAFAILIYTKKRLQKEGRLKAVHPKSENSKNRFIKNN